MFNLVIILLVSINIIDSALTPLPKYIGINSNLQKTWSEAGSLCENNHGIPGQKGLAIILNDADNNDAHDACKNSGAANGCWIGLHDIQNENHWQWQFSSSAVTYFKWAPGQPDNHANGEDCVELLTNAGSANNYKWNDLPCSFKPSGYVCDNWKTTRGYIKSTTTMNYLEAYYWCRRHHNSVLASITDIRDQNDAVRVCGGNECWIGINDLETEGTWKWMDNTNTPYTNWAPGQPDNLGNSQHCGMIWGNAHQNKWDDANCISHKSYALCNPTNTPLSAKNIIDDNFDINKFNEKHNIYNNNEFELLKYSFLGNIINILLLSIIILSIIFISFYYICRKNNNKTVHYNKVNNNDITSDSSAV